MSKLRTYIERAEVATGARQNLSRLDRLVGDQNTLLGSSVLAQYARSGAVPKIQFGVGTAAGAVAGAIVGTKYGHPVLGGFSGGSLFTNAPALLRSELRDEALWNLAQTHGGVLLAWAGDTATSRGFRFVLGWLAVGAVRALYGEGR